MHLPVFRFEPQDIESGGAYYPISASRFPTLYYRANSRIEVVVHAEVQLSGNGS